MLKYAIVIKYCDIDNIYVASVPDLLGCMAHGDTIEEAAREIKIAMELWIEVAQEYGDEIPLPLASAG
jgi:predicted RNase H-like HicB family nuclease